MRIQQTKRRKLRSVDNTKMEVLGEEQDTGQRQVECDKCSYINTCGTGQHIRIGYDLEYQTTNNVLESV
jgi:radical SAM protein with 4Fe4S-binding SPASM domain